MSIRRNRVWVLLIVIAQGASPFAQSQAVEALPAAQLSCGFVKTEITPGTSSSLMGYPKNGIPGNDGVRDRLWARACAFKSEGKPAVIVILDNCMLPSDWVRSVRGKIAGKLRVGIERVLVGATHTHSGPVPTPEYLAGIEERVIEAARRAAVSCFPVNAWVREAACGLGYTRRVASGEKVFMSWNPEINRERDVEAAPDPTLTLLALRQVNGPRQYWLWSLGVHPVTMGPTNRLVSCEWPGVACAQLEAEYPDSYAMFLLGPAGNVNPWLSTQDDPRNIDRMARAASSFVGVVQRGVRPIRADRKPVLACAATTVTIGQTALDLAVWRLGDAWIAAAPVELFSELGASLRRRLGAPVLWATLTNGSEHYWPTAAATEEGGYEPGVAPKGFTAGDGEKLIDALADLAETIHVDRK